MQGINFFAPVDSALLHALQNPRVNIADIHLSDLPPGLGMLSPPDCHDNCGCSTSRSSNASPEATATTSTKAGCAATAAATAGARK